MPEIRSKMVPFYIEPSLHTLVLEVVKESYGSVSKYVRALIISDLHRRGLISLGQLAVMAMNKPMSEGVNGNHDDNDSELRSLQTV